MKTKIIATIGPASRDVEKLKRMVKAGMNIGRINTKYANVKETVAVSKMLRSASAKVLIDIEDPSVSKSSEMLDLFKISNFEYLAVSFVSSKKQITRIRKYLEPKKVFIISKIENMPGVKNIDEIIRASDGLMVARGDLGDNIPLKKLPWKQKLIIKKSNSQGKFVITATEMLLSMVNSKIPTRAEVIDVANAVFEGSDAVMLSEETAIGKYPVQAVRMMRDIVTETEKNKKRVMKI